MAGPSDVPSKYDVVINSVGYMLADEEQPQANYGYTPTFVPRSNTQGDYGDNQQDFWMTATQNDWSLGQDQRYYRTDERSRRRFWECQSADVTMPGKVAMRADTRQITPASGIVSAIEEGGNNATYIMFFTSTNCYSISPTGTITNRGAHGQGSSPMRHAVARDASSVFISDCSSGGSVGIRRVSLSYAFSTFSATDCGSLAFLNNTLYGADFNKLYRFDSAGTATTLHTFLDAVATSDGFIVKLLALGGKLLLLRKFPENAEVWIYDGTGVAKIAELPRNFIFSNAIVSQGILYICGKHFLGLGKYRPTVYYLVNGTLDVFWKSVDLSDGYGVDVCEWQYGLVIQHDSAMRFYDPATGGSHTIAQSNNANNMCVTSGTVSLLQWYEGAADGYQHPTSAAVAQTRITSSLFDFDSSLTKIFRGVTVEWDAGTDGNGGSVDVEYILNKVDGSTVALQTSAVSGTEYNLTNISGKSIAVRVKLNKGTSTYGPVLRRISVRAVPITSASGVSGAQFRKETFIIKCTGRDSANPLVLRDGTLETNDGLVLAQALRTAASSALPVSVTDEFGTFTGVIDTDKFDLRRLRTNEFVGIVPVREV